MAKGKLSKTVHQENKMNAEMQKTKELGFRDLYTVFEETFQVYKGRTNLKVKIMDSFLFTVMIIGILNGFYGVLFARSPYKPLIASVISCIITFVLGGNLII